MKKYYGNYLGLVVTDGKDDPEQRGRVQIFIPSIMPALYDGWTKEGRDRKIMLTGNNFEDNGLTQAEINKLRLMLPWAECAAPMFGSGPAGHYMEDGTFSTQALNTGEMDAPIEGDAYENGIVDINQVLPDFGDSDGTGGYVKQTPGALRSRELSPELVNTISTGLKGTGIDWHSHSGGQKAKKDGGIQGVDRTGSWRHDDTGNGGLATDGQFKDSKTGATLNPNNPKDKARINDALVRLRQAGIRGIGWDGPVSAGGTGGYYMGVTNFHIDIAKVDDKGNVVPPNVWSSVASGQPRAKWLNDIQAATTGKIPAQPVNPTIDTSKTFANQGANMTPDGKTAQGYPNITMSQTAGIQGTQTGGGTTTNTTGVSDRELLYAMRIAAAESGATGAKGTGSYVRNQINDPLQRVGYANKPQSVLGEKFSEEELKRYGQSLITSGRANWQRVDIGFLQTNPENAKQYGFVNTGSYKEQIIGSAIGLRNYLNSRTADGAAIRDAINRGDFPTADRLLGPAGGKPFWYALGSTNGKANIAALENNIAKKDIMTALNELDAEYKSTNTIEQMSNGEYTPEAIDSTAIVQNPKEYSISPGPNTNFLPTGMFSYARTGQVVWVFFQGGDPMFPVYFAASYSQTEWQNMYQTGSGGIGAGIKNTWTSVCKLVGGGLRSAQVIPDPENGFEESEYNMELFGQYGGALRFKKSGSEFFSPYDHGSQVEGDVHDIALGNRETKTGGTHNTVVDGNYVLTVGDWSTEAVNAAEELQAIIAEASKSLDKD